MRSPVADPDLHEAIAPRQESDRGLLYAMVEHALDKSGKMAIALGFDW